MKNPAALYEFADFVLDVGQQQLQRRGTAESVALTGKTFDTLVFLVEHAGERLDKDMILKAVWPGVIVEENSLTQIISGLRQILGEARGENRYIATLPRKGYRFVAPVRDCTTSLAVLPFKPLLASEHNEALQLGMTESLISRLARQAGWKIQPLSSVRRFASLDQDAVTAGRELGVDVVLDGLMQRDNDRLRVSVRLLQVKDGLQLWAQSFEQPFTRLFEVEDAIVSQIAKALVLQPNPRNTAPPRHETEDSEAFALWASGRFAYLRLTEPSLLQAIGFFEKAIARDPNYARAYAGIADCNVLLAVLGVRSAAEVYPKARHAAGKALALRDDLAPAHVSLGQIKLVHDHDLEGAQRELTRALELDPNYGPAYFYLGNLHTYRGDVERSLAAFDRAVRLDPYTLANRAARALTLYFARRYDESITSLRQILELDERFDLARGFLLRALLAKGEYEQVLTEMKGRTLHGPLSHAFVAQALAHSGHLIESRAELSRVLALTQKQHVPAYDIAMIYAALSDTENALLWLERALHDSSPVGTMALEPALEKLHGDPRFDQLVARSRTPREAA